MDNCIFFKSLSKYHRHQLPPYNLNTANWYKEQLIKLTGQYPKFMTTASPVLGTHVGHGVVAVSFLKK
jgi:fatty acid-binding protein DegV